MARNPGQLPTAGQSPIFGFSYFFWENFPPRQGVTCLKHVGLLIWWVSLLKWLKLIKQIGLMNFGRLKGLARILSVACRLGFDKIHGDCFGWDGAHFNAQHPSDLVGYNLYLSILKTYFSKMLPLVRLHYRSKGEFSALLGLTLLCRKAAHFRCARA